MDQQTITPADIDTPNVPAGITLEDAPDWTGGLTREWIITQGTREIGIIIRHQYIFGHLYEVMAGYRSTDPATLSAAVATAVEMRDRWDGLGD